MYWLVVMSFTILSIVLGSPDKPWVWIVQLVLDVVVSVSVLMGPRPYLAAVGEELVSGCLVQRNAISGILEEYRQELRLSFNSHESAKDAAKAINTKLQGKR